MTKQESHFFDAKCFDKSAEYVGTKLKKGAPVYVEGRLSTEQWTDKATGAKRSKVVVLADRVQSLTWDTLAADAPKESKLDAMVQDAPAADEDIPF
jgi:single-strand DNA-binding protein